MNLKENINKLFPALITVSIVTFLLISFYRGKELLKKSEKEITPQFHQNESNATQYELKEIDPITGLLRWQLVAKEGNTQNNLQNALIKDIEVTVFKGKEVIFNLKAPLAKANSTTKEIILEGGVITKNKDESLILTSNRLSLSMGTSLEAIDGFSLLLKESGTLTGQSVVINEEQTKVKIKDLKNAVLKDISISGNNVYLEKDNKNEIQKAIITNGGKITLKNNDTLSANIIEWNHNGKIKAEKNIIFSSNSKLIRAGSLIINSDNSLYADNNVVILDGDTKCSGKKLSYKNNSIIEITGNPKATQGNKVISANKILYDSNLKKLQALGNVKTMVIPKA